MAPKSWPARRTAKTTARKTVPPVVPSSECTSNPKTASSTSSSCQDSPVARAESSTGAARSPHSGFPLNDASLLTSPASKNSRQIENSSPSEETSNPIKSNPETPGKMKRLGKRIRLQDEVQARDVSNLGSTGPVLRSCDDQGTILVRPKSTAPGGGAGVGLEGTNGEGSLLTVPGTLVVTDAGIEVKGKEGGDEARVEVDDKAAVVGSVKVGEGRTRKVVKKTVRIVKKIVKRRVPKRVVKKEGNVGNEETKGVENGGGHIKVGDENLEPEMSELDSMVIEKDDSNRIVEKVVSGVTLGNEETESVGNIGIFNVRDESFVEAAMNELDAVEVGNTSGAVSIETEENSSKTAGTVALEVENRDLKETQQAEAINEIKPSAESIMKGLVTDENGGNGRNQLENENAIKSGDCYEDQSAGLIQERRQDGEELVKIVERNDVGLNGGLALSGELEALERRKRRRTEIFLGGLDKDTKEEDIRKLFEQVGEVTQVRLVMNSNSGKNKGFAFLRFASAADAKKALEKYSTVEVNSIS